MHNDCALGILFRLPELGKVKSRLAQDLGKEEALRLYSLMLKQTFNLAKGLRGLTIFGFYDGNLKGFTCPDFLSIEPQKGIDLGEKLHNAFKHLFVKGFDRVCLIGSDSPTLPEGFIYQAFESLNHLDLVLGPCEDKGYYLIGMKQPMPELFRDIPWGTQDVLRLTLKKAQSIAVSYTLLPTWYDIDSVADLQRSQDFDLAI